jgi:hypothetical protein
MERHAEVSSAALSLPRRSGSRGWRPGVQAAMSGSEDPIWPGKLAGSHRQVVDAYDVNNGSPLAFAHTFLAPNGPSGAATAVIVLRHGALPIALNNAMWERYKIGESFKIIDPETKAPAVKNPFLHPKPGVLPVDEMAIDRLLETGTIFGACNVALRIQSKKLPATPASVQTTRRRNGPPTSFRGSRSSRREHGV